MHGVPRKTDSTREPHILLTFTDNTLYISIADSCSGSGRRVRAAGAMLYVSCGEFTRRLDDQGNDVTRAIHDSAACLGDSRTRERRSSARTRRLDQDIVKVLGHKNPAVYAVAGASYRF